MNAKRTTIALLLTLAFWGNPSLAAEIRAQGGAFGQFDFEIEPAAPGEPFERSLVAVQGNGIVDGVLFNYSASSDIGLGELKAFGSLDNPTSDPHFEIELGVLRANATLRDTITIESASDEDYEVIYEFHVDGLTDFDGGSGHVGALLSTGSFGIHNDSFNIDTSQTIDETLTVTRTYNGTVEQSLFLSLFLRLTEVDAHSSVSADLSNTASLNIILPEGVEIIASESGTFFEEIKPIPIPGLFPLMGLLFGWLAIRRKLSS